MQRTEKERRRKRVLWTLRSLAGIKVQVATSDVFLLQIAHNDGKFIILVFQLRLAQHLFRPYQRLPLSSSEMYSVVDLSDIVHNALGSMVVFDGT